MYDAETQTEDLQENGENPLFQSLLQGLEEIVHTRLTQPRWDESPAPGLPVFEPESPDHSSSESGLNELGQCKLAHDGTDMSGCHRDNFENIPSGQVLIWGIGTVAKIVDIIILKNLGSLLKNIQEVL